jgi:hypothetical protein
VAGGVPLRDEPGVVELVERALLESDREGPQRLGPLFRRERSEQRGVDAAREENAHGHVADEVGADGVADPRAQLLDELRLVAPPLFLDRNGRRPRKAFDPHRARLRPDEQVPGRQLPDLTEDRQRRGDRVEGEERLERVEVDLAAREGAELGRELEPVRRRAVVERLDPEPVARKDEPPPARVPDRRGEHPAQPFGECVAVFLVEVEKHLRVAARAKAVAGTLELAAELAVVVDLAVLDDMQRPVLVSDRLVAGREVDDREAAGR